MITPPSSVQPTLFVRERKVVVGKGKRAKLWTIREVFAGPLTPEEAWARVEPILVRLLMPKLLEILARDRAAAEDGSPAAPESQKG